MRLLLLLLLLTLQGCAQPIQQVSMIESATNSGCLIARWSKQPTKEYVLCYKPEREDSINE